MRVILLGPMLRGLQAGQFWGTNEAAAIARSLALGHGFSSAFHDTSAPTAWLAPGYPAILAVIFRVFGIYSRASAVVVVGFNILFSAATAVVVLRIAKRVFDPTVALLAGWVWAACPYEAIMPLLPWETSLSALLLSLGFLLLLRLEDAEDIRPWLLAGLFWGLAALVNPALVAPVPFLVAYECWRQPRAGSQSWRPALAFVAVFVAVLTPWTTRNYCTFGRLFFVRSNFGAEFFFGNLGFSSSPLGNSMEYQWMGESAYVAQQGERAVGYVRQHPAEFVERTGGRILEFWSAPESAAFYAVSLSVLSWLGLGLALREQGARSMPFLIALVCYPLVYYLTYVLARQRHPIEPLMLVLSTHAARRMGQWAAMIAQRKG